MSKVWSVGKNLVEMEESAGTVIRFFEYCTKFTGKCLCCSIFLINFQALRPAALLQSDYSKDVFQ